MATLYSSTGAAIGQETSVSLPDIEAKLRAHGYSERDLTHIPGDQLPRNDPVMKWATYLLIRVYDSEPKTTLFPKSGFYSVRELTVNNARFLLEPEK